MQQNENKKYKLIYADPAWPYRDKCNSGDRGANHKYDLMSLTDLKRLPVTIIPTNGSLSKASAVS